MDASLLKGEESEDVKNTHIDLPPVPEGEYEVIS